MRKNLPTFAVLFAMLASLFFFTQCTPEKRPQTEEEMLADIEKNYTQKKETEKLTFYFKEINKIRTNDFYSIDKDDGTIYKSPFFISEKEARQLKKTLDEHPEYLERTFDLPQTLPENPDWKAAKTEELTTIVKYEGKIFPMKRIDIQYQKQGEDYKHWERYYFNLIDGSAVDYDRNKTN